MASPCKTLLNLWQRAMIAMVPVCCWTSMICHGFRMRDRHGVDNMQEKVAYSRGTVISGA